MTDWNSKWSFTLLLGPSNSGKTSWFLNFAKLRSLDNNILITVVDKEEICPCNKKPKQIDDVCTFVNLTNASDNQILSKFTSKCNVNIFIDEIHLFTIEHLKHLDQMLNRLEPTNLFIGMLPGSYTQDPLPNTFNLVARAHNIILTNSICVVCACPTTQSRRVDHEDQESSQLIVGKILFATMCSKCSEQKKKLI